MLLRCYFDERNVKQYTMKLYSPDGRPTFDAHPAHFSPHDQNSHFRIKMKRRYGILMKNRMEDFYYKKE
ncbi:MAG: snoRNP complex protein [Paramarteilia canceri]